MVQRSQKLRFALEAREALRRLGKDRGKDFDGDLALEFRIARAIASPMPPAPMGSRISQDPSRVWFSIGISSKRTSESNSLTSETPAEWGPRATATDQETSSHADIRQRRIAHEPRWHSKLGPG